jgi:myo-inositol-1(or 4)-monophosphatase
MESKPMNQTTPTQAVDPFHVELLDLATRMAEAAGSLIADGLQRVRTLDTKSSGTDLVTEMDRASEQLIVSMIEAERPDDGILGEEGTSRQGTNGVRWLIDPIDGTTNYVYRHPLFSVSIGVQVDEVTVAGAVNAPMIGDLYTGVLGGGAFRNGHPIRVSEQTQLSHSLIGTGFAYIPEIRAIQGQRLAYMLPRIREIRRGGSAAIDLCFVADGRLDAYFEDGLQPWDECAGLLIAAEAGAVHTRLQLHREVLLASSPAIAASLEQLIVDAPV